MAVRQTGVTHPPGSTCPGRVVTTMSEMEFPGQVEHPDAVVSLTRLGSVVRCPEARKVPALVPRRSAHGEHVNDLWTVPA